MLIIGTGAKNNFSPAVQNINAAEMPEFTEQRSTGGNEMSNQNNQNNQSQNRQNQQDQQNRQNQNGQNRQNQQGQNNR